MNVFRYIILTCCAALDIGLFIFGVVGFITFVGDPYPSVPIAMVMSWTLGALVLAVKDETQTPVEVLRNMDYVLSRDDIDPKAYRLMDFYYNAEKTDSPLKRGTHSSFKRRSRKYFFDYYRAVCSRFDVPRYYCVDFSWERFHQLAQILDRRYQEFCRSGFDEDELEQDERILRSQYFDSAAELLYERGTPKVYVQMCADAYESMSAHLSKAISGKLLEYCTEEIPDEDAVPEKILPHFHPQRVLVMKPESEEIPAYMILGESEWEEEHGVAFTVIGNYAVNSSYYADAESPWSDDMIWEYRLQRDAEQGNFCEVDPVPAQFGGDNAGSGRIRMVAAAAQLKEEIDEMIEALFMLKMADKYDYKVVYDGKEPSYIFISALKNDMRTFADSIRLK